MNAKTTAAKKATTVKEIQALLAPTTSAERTSIITGKPAKEIAAERKAAAAKKVAAKPAAKKAPTAAAMKYGTKKAPKITDAEKAAKVAAAAKREEALRTAGTAKTTAAALKALTLAALNRNGDKGSTAAPTHKPMTPTALPFQAGTLKCWGACGHTLPANSFGAGTPGKTRRTECQADARDRLAVNAARAANGLEILPRPKATV